MNKEVNRRAGEAQVLHKRVATLETQLEAVYSSLSWRITAPLRAVYRSLQWLGQNTRRAFTLLRWLGTGQFARAGRALLPYYQRRLPLSIRKMIPAGVREAVSKALATDYYTEEDVPLLGLKLRGLGLTVRAYADLQRIAEDDTDRRRQGLASWELALWHADRYTAADAAQCLRYLTKARPADDPETWRERCAILAAECYAALGREEEGRQAIQEALSSRPSEDLYFAAANLESSISDRVAYISRALQQTGASPLVSLAQLEGKYPFDCIRPPERAIHSADCTCKVTIIVPAYNSETTIQTALLSLLAQTWQDLEILVVDDGSTDTTAELVERQAGQDPRVKLIRAGVNRGPFVARNLGVKSATGDFITCHDADDWCHPQRVETQVRDLLADQTLVGNASRWTRMTNDLKAYRRGNPGYYIQINLSSLMFRREAFLDGLGAWDSVRFGADSELWSRARKRFGAASIRILPQVLAFGRSSSQSLTENAVFGYPGYFIGARREYHESYEWYYRSGGGLHYSFPQTSRPFPVPGIMRTEREPRSPSVTRLELAIASDFRVPDNCRFAMDIIGRRPAGNPCTGLVQLPRYDVDPRLPVRDELRDKVDGTRVQMLVYGEKISCDRLVVFDPAVLREVQKYLPDIKAARVFVIVNQTPAASRPEGGANPLEVSAANAERLFGVRGTWVAMNSHIRAELAKNIAMYPCAIALAPQTWEQMSDTLLRQAAGEVEPVEQNGRERPVSAPFLTNGQAHEGPIQCIDVQDLERLQHSDENGVAVVMPCIDAGLGMETAKVLLRRAGMPCTIFIVLDSLRQGFVRTLNDAAERISARYIVYLGQDAYPGRDWLNCAYQYMEESGKGLLGFNDGKWRGRIASFGMVRTAWVKTLYGGPVFYPGYRSHKADNELTVIARALDTYHYAPDCVVMDYDPQKDFGGSNPADDRVFKDRFIQGFDGLAPLERLRLLEDEYLGKPKKKRSGR